MAKTFSVESFESIVTQILDKSNEFLVMVIALSNGNLEKIFEKFDSNLTTEDRPSKHSSNDKHGALQNQAVTKSNWTTQKKTSPFVKIRPLRMALTNTRSLQNKQNDLILFLLDYDSDIFSVVETFFTPNDPDEIFLPPS
ncbi:hypothetical protein HELRODRAFT_166852 [Helobdella robusta]|uniref:Uncharacterized protein n=1 Tax=Helobdella robusta TaxID=6412 RepID=T1EYM6_HELRO|nr:hypothetical protein HELRODRAFT_166852 [Helobdella robusta]ESO11804.1 hypothetical protein HELRODRAFT_166852 [Helobdella robusta]